LGHRLILEPFQASNLSVHRAGRTPNRLFRSRRPSAVWLLLVYDMAIDFIKIAADVDRGIVLSEQRCE
jgi:hypothetical protein